MGGKGPTLSNITLQLLRTVEQIERQRMSGLGSNAPHTVSTASVVAVLALAAVSFLLINRTHSTRTHTYHYSVAASYSGAKLSANA